MSPNETARSRTAQLLRSAARYLETVDPNPVMGPAIADAIAMTKTTPVAPQFAESSPGSLSLLVHPGGSTRDRVALSTEAAGGLVQRHFGSGAARWLAGRMEQAQDARSEAFFGGGFDRDGVAEGVVGFDLFDRQVDLLPHGLGTLAKVALAAIPGARVLSTMIRCGRAAGTQQVTVEAASDMALADLKPLMDEVGLGHQHPSLMSAAAFLLGARFTMPGGSSRVTLRPIREGVELRLDIVLERIPDPPPQLLSLLRLWMTERPRSVQGLDRWLSAFTPDGFPNAGDVTVLSVWVRPNVPARTALFLRPAALAAEDPVAAPPRPPRPAAASAVASPWD
ncbi:MAG TPA: hypothetical protein VLT33_45695 [Labilithrix sp.]|nr:hypothetical protein [Labilithrix sp.]